MPSRQYHPLVLHRSADGFAAHLDAATGRPNLDLLTPHFLPTFVPGWRVLVSSSAIAIDLFGTFTNRAGKDRTVMLLMRLRCALFVALSLAIAMSKVDVIVNLMVMAWTSLAGAFLAPFLYGLFWKRATKAGAGAAMFTGVGTSVTLFLWWGKPSIPIAGAIAMIVPMIVMPLVSLMTQPPKAAIIEKAFASDPA